MLPRGDLQVKLLRSSMPKLRHTAEGGGPPKTWDFPCDVLEICFGSILSSKQITVSLLYVMASFEKK